MKTRSYLFTLTACFALLTAPAAAQECDETPATFALEGNAVSALFSTGGDAFFDGRDAGYTVTPPATSGVQNDPFAVLFAAGLWMGAKDPGGNIKVATQTYGRFQGRFDYRPGPLTRDGTQLADDCSEWNRSFPITRGVVEAHRAAHTGVPLDPATIDPMILGWPALGNPYFRETHGFDLPTGGYGLAEYWDKDLDGRYDPTHGDYPLFCGDQAAWSVFNDATVHRSSSTPSNLLMEVQQLVYSFNSDDPVLNATTFQSYEFIYRGQEDLIDFHAAQWIDYDLGCYTNDRFNSIPESNLFYVYNETADEGDSCPGGVTTSGATSPVAVVQVVEGLKAVNADSTGEVDLGMSALATYYNSALGGPNPGTTDPQTAEEYYNYLSGRWRDGQPITRGGLGYATGGGETKFVNDGGPNPDGTAWLDCNQPQTTPFRDKRIVMSSGPVTMRPGAVNRMTIAVTTIFDVVYANDCPDESAVLSAAASIKDLYDQSCTLSVLSTSVKPQPASNISLSVYPNPTNGVVTFELPAGDRISSVQLFSITGQRVAEVAETSDRVQYDTAHDNLSPGVYFYVVSTVSGKVASGRISVIR